MLEIKTLIHKACDPGTFDDAVNAALAEGWELVRRDVLPETESWQPHLYAELERGRTTEEGEDNTAQWETVSRISDKPYRCSKCGHRVGAGELTGKCPACKSKITAVC